MEILRNIDSSIKLLKIIALVSICTSVLFSGYVFFYSMREIDKSRDKVYLLSNGEALELVRSRNLRDNLQAEIKNHISMYHEFFYNLDPDPKDITKRVNMALNLIDQSGKLSEAQRQESMYYHKMIDGSISSRIYIDSISVQENKDYYVCKIFGKQKLERSSRYIIKNLNASCNIRQVARTDNNPHGLMIENYNLIDNSTLYEKDK